jgi:hypothetical protein
MRVTRSAIALGALALMVGSVLAGDRQKLAGYCFGVFDSEVRRGIPPPPDDTQGRTNGERKSTRLIAP